MQPKDQAFISLAVTAIKKGMYHALVCMHADTIQADIFGAVLPHIPASRAWHCSVRQHTLSILWRASQEILSS